MLQTSALAIPLDDLPDSAATLPVVDDSPSSKIRLHVVSPDAQTSSGEIDVQSNASQAQNLSVQGRLNLRARRAQTVPIDDIGTNEFAEITSNVLHVAFGNSDAAIQRIAQVANVNPKTARNWWESKCAPGPIALLRLMAHVPEFAGEMRRLAGMESDLDPELERAMNDMVRLMQRGTR